MVAMSLERGRWMAEGKRVKVGVLMGKSELTVHQA
jgi:hypothetical protein